MEQRPEGLLDGRDDDAEFSQGWEEIGKMQNSDGTYSTWLWVLCNDGGKAAVGRLLERWRGLEIGHLL